MAKKKSKSGKKWKIILLIVVLLLVAIFLGINGYIESIVKNKVNEQLNENPISLYSLTYDDLDINILAGSVSIKNIQLNPSDSAKLLLKNGFIRNLFESQVELFKIKRLNIFDFLSNRNLTIKKVIIRNLTTAYLTNKNAPKAEKRETQEQSTIFPIILNNANIDDFEFINASFIAGNIEDAPEYFFEIDSLSVMLHDIHIDEQTLKNPIPISFTGIDLNTRHFSLKSMEYYNIATSGINFNIQDTSVTINDFRLIPKFSKSTYNQQIKYNNDWFDISTHKIVIKGLSLEEYIRNKSFNFQSVSVFKPDIKIYRDKRLPDAPFKKKLLIASLVKKIPFDIDIKSLKVIEGKLAYEEMLDLSDTPGKVYFDPLYLNASNITNNTDLISINPNLLIDLEGKLMGKGDISAKLNIQLNSNEDYFTAKGNLEAMDGTALNEMFKSLLLAEILEWDIHSAEFDFTANDDISSGTLDLKYENLKIEVLQHKNPEKKSKFYTWLAGEVVKKNNIPDHKKYKSGIIRFERRKDKAIVNYLWNSLKTGIISTLAPIADKNKKVEKKERKAVLKQEKGNRNSKKSDKKK